MSGWEEYLKGLPEKIIIAGTAALEVEITKSIHKNFEEGGRPVKWQASKKSKRTRGTKTLVVTGNLSMIIVSADPKTGKIIAEPNPLAAGYARIHNEGGQIKMPARQYKFRVKTYKDDTERSVFAGKKHKRISKITTGKAYVINIPKREFLIVPDGDFPGILDAVAASIKF